MRGGEGGGPGPLVLLQRLLLPPLTDACRAVTPVEVVKEETETAAALADASERLRTETLDKPPPSMGTHPPDESSRVITCALTRTSESLL